MSKEDMNKEETIRSVNGEIISSGVDRTERDSGGIISSGVGQNLAPTISLNEIVINGERYIITQQLATSGEAEVFLAKRGNDEYVIKLYYPSFMPKKEIIEKLKGLTHPDIISIIDYGWYQNRFVEVMEYARGGSLYEKIPIKDPKFLKQIVKEVVNALEFCHSRGIIHRDLKPQNIFFRDSSQRDIVIGDFGISSVLDEGYSKRLTGQARTLTYAAPELFQSIRGKTVIDKEVDYYSLGITLIHLWSGEEPFKDLGEYGVMRMKMEGRVEIPEDMPNEFKTLVKGLLVVNPAKRWGYKEVQKWLNGEVVPVEYEVIKEYPPFIFGKVGNEELVATDPESLADLMEKYEELGKRHLYRRAISEWLKNKNQYLYTAIESIIEEEYPRDQRAGLIKAIYVLDSGRGFKGVDGNRYSTPEEIAKCLEENFSYYEEELKKETAELYLYLEARGYKGEADKFRKLFKNAPSGAALNTLILSLEGEDLLIIDINDPKTWYKKGIEFYDLGKYERAIKCFDEAIKLRNGDFPDAWYNKGLAFYALGRFDEAIKCYDEVIKLRKGDFPEFWYNKGNALSKLGKFKEAIECFDKAIKLGKRDDPDAWYNKGNAFYALGRFDEAIKCYDEAIKLRKGDFPDAWNNKGNAFYALGKFGEAIKCFDEVIKLRKGNDPEAWFNKGNALYYLFRFEEAIKCYDEAIRLRNGDYSEALEAKNRALSILNKWKK
ncbi:MAG: hypothetical protein CBR30_06700 [Dictyoglomus sp. NZ13-RE01]|nr:MAG: hypothetical protein CBR30_06700 [Dictyoglomus sp. NZ13-RE01]